MDQVGSLTDRLRSRILAGLHVGHLRPGGRLPSLRDLSREWGADHRAVRAAYRQLEAEGLVEVRRRSGIYAAGQETLNDGILAETARWLTEVLVGAWVRRVATPQLPAFVHQGTGRVAIRCAVLESNEDQSTGLIEELERDFGLEASAVTVPAGARTAESLTGAVGPLLRGADLLITTAFHAAELAPVAAALGKPLLTGYLNPHFVDAMERALEAGTATYVIADPRFGDRLRTMFDGGGERLRIVLADDRAAVDRLDPDRPIFLTRAARKRIGERPFRLAFPHSPSISAAVAREICGWIVRLNVGAVRGP